MKSGELWKIKLILQGDSEPRNERGRRKGGLLCVKLLCFLPPELSNAPRAILFFPFPPQCCCFHFLNLHLPVCEFFPCLLCIFYCLLTAFPEMILKKCHYSQVQMKLTMQISPILTCIWMKKTEQVAGGMIKVLNEWSHEGSVIHAMPILQGYAQPSCYIYFRILKSRTHHVFNNLHFLFYKLQWTLNVPAFNGSILPLRDEAVYWGKVRVCSCLMYFTFLHRQLIFELLTNGPRIKLLPDEYWFKIHSSI